MLPGFLECALVVQGNTATQRASNQLHWQWRCFSSWVPWSTPPKYHKEWGGPFGSPQKIDSYLPQRGALCRRAVKMAWMFPVLHHITLITKVNYRCRVMLSTIIWKQVTSKTMGLIFKNIYLGWSQDKGEWRESERGREFSKGIIVRRQEEKVRLWGMLYKQCLLCMWWP